MATVHEYAWAKINLYLDVGQKRADGYHDVVTVMQTVDLSDTVVVTREAGQGISLSLSGAAHIPTDSRNTAWRAAEAFLRAVGEEARILIDIEKRIPIAGGLAGGSADAGAVLRAMNRLWGYPFTVEELCTIAGQIGADVPFCTRMGLALAHGRGDVLTPLSTSLVLHILLTNGGEPVSTHLAYEALDEAATAHFHHTPNGCITALQSGDKAGLANALYNSFEEVILPTCPEAMRRKNAFLSAGALGALMSGSGSSVFGIFPDAETAKTVQKQLPFSTIYVTNQIPQEDR